MSDWSGLACQCESLRDDCYLFGTLYRTHVPYHSGTITEHVCTVGKALHERPYRSERATLLQILRSLDRALALTNAPPMSQRTIDLRINQRRHRNLPGALR